MAHNYWACSKVLGILMWILMCCNSSFLVRKQVLLYYQGWVCILCSILLNAGAKILNGLGFFYSNFIFLYVFTYFSNTRGFMSIFWWFVMPVDFIPLVICC